MKELHLGILLTFVTIIVLFFFQLYLPNESFLLSLITQSDCIRFDSKAETQEFVSDLHHFHTLKVFDREWIIYNKVENVLRRLRLIYDARCAETEQVIPLSNRSISIDDSKIQLAMFANALDKKNIRYKTVIVNGKKYLMWNIEDSSQVCKILKKLTHYN